MQPIRIIFLAVCLTVESHVAEAQTKAPESKAQQDWQVTTYPVLAWVPLDIAIDVDIPPVGGGGSGSGSGSILNSRFDGAFFAGVAASDGVWRIEGYGLWAGVGGDRPERPFMEVDV